MAHTRRELLLRAGCGALGKAAFVTGFERFSQISAMAAPITPTDYKALVCIFLFGGNDANNTIISVDRYANYAAARGDLVIPQASLLPVTPAGGGQYGLHPSLVELHQLWGQNKVAALCNVGTLIAPITKDQYRANAPKPYQLFSHSDQQNQWQTSVSASETASGWAGRMADATMDAASGFPTITSVSGVTVFSAGLRTSPLAIAPAPTALNQTLRLKQPDDALKQLVQVHGSATSPALVRAASSVVQQSLNSSALLSSDPVINTVFPATGLGNQLKQVAKLIKLSPQVGLKRQIFFCSLGGFDTHNGQLSTQASLLMQLSQAMSAFYSATVELGVSSKVTTFTLSDFARTFKPAGTGVNTVGSDHAWGSHHFVMGDAVRGGNFYGVFPDITPGGPDDTEVGTSARGRWIPTTAVDQYAATLALWYGLPVSDLSLIFPNIGRFSNPNLGFLV